MFLVAFFQWIDAVRREVRALITGSLVLAIMGLLQGVWKVPIPKVAYGVVLAVFLAWAVYGAWATEHSARVAAEKKLNDEAPQIILALAQNFSIAARGKRNESLFSLINCGKRPATFVRVEPLESVGGKYKMRFLAHEVLRPDGHPVNLVHHIDGGIEQGGPSVPTFWEFLHDCPADLQIERFDLVIWYRDMQEDKQTTARLAFDMNIKSLGMLPS